ncbi:UNVERIFIED_CONTAM: hypothetical protein FKN15_077938 [Acipenser sinensis]
MAPTIAAAMGYSQGHVTMTNKLRKPVVEKMRRDRINSSIEQLKTLLGKEFVKQQPDSKLEKADILEMTVCYLRQSASPRPATGNEGYSRPGFLKGQVKTSTKLGYSQGFSQCLQESLRFLSVQAPQQAAEMRVKEHFHGSQNATQSRFSPEPLLNSVPPQVCTKQPAISSPTAVWRPW